MNRKFLPIVLAVLALTAQLIAAAAIAFIGVSSDVTDQTTYTIAGVNIGTASADRCVIVGSFARRASASATTLDSVTIGGNAATILAHAEVNESSAHSVAAIAALTVAAGTTATIVHVYNAAMSRHAIAVSQMTGTACTTAADTDTSSANSPTVNLDIPAGGAALAICGSAGGSATAAWTNITERHDAVFESLMMFSGASDNFASLQTGLALTCTITNGSTGEAGVFVSWGPTAGATTPARVVGGMVF